MKEIYFTIYSEMESYDSKQNFSESLSNINTKLSDRQIRVIYNASEKLNMTADQLLRWLLDIQFERIHQFVDTYNFAYETISPEDKK